jgi:hypothetical protein
VPGASLPTWAPRLPHRGSGPVGTESCGPASIFKACPCPPYLRPPSIYFALECLYRLWYINTGLLFMDRGTPIRELQIPIQASATPTSFSFLNLHKFRALPYNSSTFSRLRKSPSSNPRALNRLSKLRGRGKNLVSIAGRVASPLPLCGSPPKRQTCSLSAPFASRAQSRDLAAASLPPLLPLRSSLATRH